MDDDFQKLVYARLQTLPKGYSISIGGVGDLTKEEALAHVNKKDKIGELLIAADRHYFNLLKTGDIYAGITDSPALKTNFSKPSRPMLKTKKVPRRHHFRFISI